jgi:nitrite reductase/ring-hydroxylating ferredoxin subunit
MLENLNHLSLAEHKQWGSLLAANDVWVTIASTTVLSAGEMMGTQLGETYIALYNVDGRYFATSDMCSHAFALLSNGFLEGHVVECPLHAGCFDVRTGEGVGEPSYDPISVFPVRIVGNEVQVRI